ncbi:energy transducer TonB [Larkinella rosea]|uniref:TonB family protein n=1 Tax=Larkinella rosea TaxID=2025312 RepID=A0A3P1BRZ6_9BACT|nr:energy transducer TonB [Larkinella rosea]RRB03739.1 TonB family protein [Larkinella rosea]
MKYYRYILLFLLPTFSVHAQTIYKESEVDSAARPLGGLPLLEKFIDANRRMPYAAEVDQAKGSVILSGVVEPNGTVSEVKTLRSLRPDCDREAIRVFNAFKAWKPALKGGKPVRQELTFTVPFTSVELNAKPDRIIRYYDKKGVPVADEANSVYQFVTVVDSLGYPNAAPIIYRKSGKNWKEVERYQLNKEPFTYHNEDDPALPDSVEAYRLEIIDKMNTAQETHYSFFTDGSPLSKVTFRNGNHTQSSRFYYRNGLVRKMEEFVEDYKTHQWLWYPNGQLRQQAQRQSSPQTGPEFQVLSQWDSLGRPTVVNGAGQATFESRRSKSRFLESGAVKQGLKDGEWTGRRSDGYLEYRETYDMGKCLSGKFYAENGEVLTYTEPEIMPDFKGGRTALGRFLATTMRYPPEAARAKLQGRVFVSFVIDKEGNVENVKVLKGIGASADEEAVRVVKATSGQWIPGVERGRNVKVRFNLPINFELE